MTQQTQEPERVPDLIPPEAAAQVGAVVARASGEVVRRDWQRWAVAVGDHNPLWFDADHARAQGYDDVVAPPLYLQYAVLGVTAARPAARRRLLRGVVGQPRLPGRAATDGRRGEHDVPPPLRRTATS